MPKRSKKTGVIFVTAGAALIVLALSLWLYNRYEDARAGEAAANALTAARAAVGGETTPAPNYEYEYAGYLRIPALGLELPVLAEWDYARLKIAPCRQFGAAATNDLVIAGHNYRSHFGKLSRLKPGGAVFFTDMEGVEHAYTAARLETLSPAEGAAVRDSGYPLTLYTCAYGGKTRVVVFCNTTPNE